MGPPLDHRGLLLDGRNRILACRIAGVKPVLVEWQAPEGVTPTEWVIAQNLTRRHLDQSQAAACAVKALPLLKAEARERQRRQASHGAEGDRGKTKNPGGNNASRVSRAPQSRDTAASLFGVSARYVQAAQSVNERFPQALEAVRTGTITLPVAVEIAKLDEAVRPRALAEAVRAGKSKALRTVCALAQQVRAANFRGIETAPLGTTDWSSGGAPQAHRHSRIAYRPPTTD